MCAGSSTEHIQPDTALPEADISQESVVQEMQTDHGKCYVKLFAQVRISACVYNAASKSGEMLTCA